VALTNNLDIFVFGLRAQEAALDKFDGFGSLAQNRVDRLDGQRRRDTGLLRNSTKEVPVYIPLS
jgi:hypothetical protein